MSDDTRQQPVAIRVTRPFATPDEFLDHEIETLTRTSITLLGAQPRPKGVILRFEVALSTGTQLLRGEGRVVGFKENAFGDQPGLVSASRASTPSRRRSSIARPRSVRRARAALQAAMGEDASLPPPGEIVPSSIAPHSIGPMSVMQDVPSPPPVVAAPPTDRGGAFASSPPTRPAPLTAPPAFFTPPAPSEALEAPPPPAQSSSSRSTTRCSPEKMRPPRARPKPPRCSRASTPTPSRCRAACALGPARAAARAAAVGADVRGQRTGVPRERPPRALAGARTCAARAHAAARTGRGRAAPGIGRSRTPQGRRARRAPRPPPRGAQGLSADRVASLLRR
ncbi:MAG: hypothetical protein U0235_29045 [Polyangiaceae bacterium]